VAQRTSKPKSIRVDLSKEKPGRDSTKFLAVVGNWSVVDDGGTKVLGVDGRQWLRGQPAGGLAQNARAIYGSRHEEFIDNVKAFAYFPYAVAKDIDDFHDGKISMRFKLVAGQLDQCAGILFNLKPNGDYLTVRFNGKEDNVVLWTFVKGKRSFREEGNGERAVADEHVAHARDLGAGHKPSGIARWQAPASITRLLSQSQAMSAFGRKLTASVTSISTR
jgi:hypothetical protein